MLPRCSVLSAWSRSHASTPCTSATDTLATHVLASGQDGVEGRDPLHIAAVTCVRTASTSLRRTLLMQPKATGTIVIHTLNVLEVKMSLAVERRSG